MDKTRPVWRQCGLGPLAREEAHGFLPIWRVTVGGKLAGPTADLSVDYGGKAKQGGLTISGFSAADFSIFSEIIFFKQLLSKKA